MNKTNVVGIIIALTVLGGIIWFAQPGSESSTASASSVKTVGSLAVEETNFDFGTVSMAAGNVTHAFKIKNAGSEDVVIEKMYTSCMCTIASLIKNEKQFGPYGMPGHGFIPSMNEIMRSGEEATISVTFDPAAHGPAGIGRIERTVTIENSTGKPIKLEFSTSVTP